MKPDCRHVIRGLPLELAMTPGELVMYSILRGDEPPVEVSLAVLGDKRISLASKKAGTSERNPRTRALAKSNPRVLANAITPFRFCGNSLSQCAAEGARKT